MKARRCAKGHAVKGRNVVLKESHGRPLQALPKVRQCLPAATDAPAPAEGPGVTEQLDLMPEAVDAAITTFRRSDPETSKEAAAAAESLAGEQNSRILAALGRMPGRRGTYYEIAQEAGLLPIQVARRLGHRYGLVGAGLVRSTGETRPLPTRRAGRVYELVS